MQDDISDLRGQINQIDEQLVGLLNQRAGLAKRIGNTKKATGDEVYDPDRERSVLERVDALNEGPLDKGALEEVFACIITACREIQME